ncbi:NB-ARC domain-containing protein [Nonomuraea ferruginea]
MKWLREALLHADVAVIDGPGGVGKSALAVHVAHTMSGRFRDGVIYVDLNGATPGLHPLPVLDGLGHLLRSLGLDGSAVPADVEGAVARYRSLTAAGELLVILDNALDAHQVRPLVPAGARCRTVITSRAALTTLDDVHHPHPTGLGDVRHLHLAGLADRDAVTLLSRIAGPDRVQREPEAAAEIAGLCGGFPLAVQVAAARLAARPDWRLADLADRLADATRRLDTLQYDDLAVRASIAVSHRHLREEPSGHDAAYVLPLLGLLDTPTHTPAATAALAQLARATGGGGTPTTPRHPSPGSREPRPVPFPRPHPPVRPRTGRRRAVRDGPRGRAPPRVPPLPGHGQHRHTARAPPRCRILITGRSSPASRSPTRGRPANGPRRSGTTSSP